MIERDEDDDDDDDDEEEEETKMRVYVSSCVACLSSSRKGSSSMLRKYGRRLRLLINYRVANISNQELVLLLPFTLCSIASNHYE